MRRSRCGVLTISSCALAAASIAGCSTDGQGTRWSRHFDASVWGGALGQQVHHADRLVPEVALLATIPLAFAYDDDIQEHYADYSVDSTTSDASSVLQVVLPVIPVTFGVVQWAQGDGGEKFEVVAASLGGVVLVQQILSKAVGRERPNGQDDLSFPSGHSSWAFAATTLIVRELHEPSDDSFHLVDGLLYLPATFAAWERVASNKHWASDAAVGAFLGVFLTNWIWDAHYGSDEGDQPTIYDDVRKRGIVWSPRFDMIDGQVVFGISGGF
jgi:membrane-associated phospholipid phosphatase